MSRFAKHVALFFHYFVTFVFFVRNDPNSHPQGRVKSCTMKDYCMYYPSFSTTVLVGLLLVGWPVFQRGYFGPKQLRLTGLVTPGTARYLGEYYSRAVI